MHIHELCENSCKFSEQLRALKEQNPAEDFTWYGYDILGNITHLDHLLTGPNRDIFSQLKGLPIADVGAADGDLAFLLEDNGFTSEIIDYGPTNWNGLRGARRLRELLGSKIEIHELNLDDAFQMPRERYGMILMLGILYHLKNPFFVLERFARHSNYLMLSTRIARFTMDQTLIREQPLAYLLAPDECNNDATNYWIFSEAGLKRILQRSGWNVLDFYTVGDRQTSNPGDSNRDERAFVFARPCND
jgi:2-polyprenyl-3-methyl-5-hydroxy-6-metoxy-1,4-benzoquinol methylase